ncbi:MAG: carboxypeptidase-like regulatory domain-containing protein, partial [Bacteroidaceae bacterium]|nr:carboxypeptidase-like regulatory domain-containing protein [Bacteroidaceae bacterium]
MKRFLLTTCLLFVVCIGLLANAGTVKGKVVDARTKEALEYVTIGVSRYGETDLIRGAVTDLSGLFSITGLASGKYTLTISFVGYQDLKKDFLISSSTRTVNLRQLALQEDNKVLKEVQVVGQRAQMKFEIDKKVFDVDQNIAATGGSASDVLTNIPSVEVDNEGEVSLRG